MALDKATVAHIAALARIRLSEAELEPLADELSCILTWMEQLNEVDSSGVAPMASVAAAGCSTSTATRVSRSSPATGLPMLDDVVTDGARREEVLGNAPRTARGFFVVPKVVE